MLAALMFGTKAVNYLEPRTEDETYDDAISNFFMGKTEIDFDAYSEAAGDILEMFLTVKAADRPSITRILQSSEWLDSCKAIRKKHSRIRRSVSGGPRSPSKLLVRRNSSKRFSFDSDDVSPTNSPTLPPISTTNSPRSPSPFDLDT